MKKMLSKIWVAAGLVVAIAAPAVGAADISRGQQLYQANCAVCHGADPAAGSPRKIADKPEVLDSAIDKIGRMRFLRGVLTQADIADLAAYVGSVVNPTQPQPSIIEPKTGWYWNSAESGRGFFVEKRGSKVFMSGFLYADDGRATWFIAVGEYTANRMSAAMQTYSGGQTLTGAYKTPVVGTSPGTVVLEFSSPEQAKMTWPGGTVALQRFPFGSNGTVEAPVTGAPESGWWWAKDESGRGYALEIQGSNLFVVGYMYDSTGNPLWYLAAGPMSSPLGYADNWEQFANGQSLTGTYRPAQQINADAGRLSVDFSSATTGTLTFPDGRKVAIERFVF